MTTFLERLRPRPAIVPGLLVATLALAGCGGGEDSSSTNAGAGTATTQKDGTTKQQDGTSARRDGGAGASELQACLKKQGVEFPERPTGQNGERPEGAPEGGTPPEGGAPPEGGPGGEGGLPGGGAPPAGADGEGRRGGFGNLSDEEREKLQKAMEECGGGRGGPGATDGRGGPNGARRRPDVTSKTYQKSIKAYVACVRKNGYDLPDPDFSGDGPIFDPKKVDQQDATFKKASVACQSELRSQRSEGDAGSTTTSVTPSSDS